MFVVIAILIGLIIGFARGGSVSSIFNHLYKKWYLGFAGVIMLILLHYSYLVQPLVTPIEQYLPILNFIAYILVLLMLIFNLDDFFTICISIGVTLNFIVTFINSGYLPVSDAVLSQIPINYALVQSIYTGMNGIYSLMQPQTLLSFLGIIIPFPILSSFIALFGSIPGFSIGDILILIGIAGAIQAAMVLSKKEPQIVSLKEEQKPRVKRKSTPVTTQRRPQHFESRTEELFFEDSILPEDPLDKIFGEEPQGPTKIIDDLSDVKIVNTGENHQFNESSGSISVDDLTKPLGTGIINSKEINKRINQQQEEVEPLSEDEGFFASSYLNGKENSTPITTEEIFKDTNVINDVQFVTNDIDVQTAEIVVDEGEKPIYKPTQEKIERERQTTQQTSQEQPLQFELMTVEPEFEVEEESVPVKVIEEPVRKGLIDKTPIPKASEQQPTVQEQKPSESLEQKKSIEEVVGPLFIEQKIERPIVVKPKPIVQKSKEQVVLAPSATIQKPVNKVVLTPELETNTIEEKRTPVAEQISPKPEEKAEKGVEEINETVESKPEVVQTIEKVEEQVKPRKKFGLAPGNFLYLSSKLKPTKAFVPDESLIEEKTVSEPTQELSNINDIFFDYDQYQLLLNSIKDQEFRQELEKTFRDYSKSKLGLQPASQPVVTETENIETVSTEYHTQQQENEEPELKLGTEETIKNELEVPEETTVDSGETNVETSDDSTSLVEEELAEEKTKVKEETTDEKEITDIIKADIDEAPKLKDLLEQESVKEPITEEASEELDEIKVVDDTVTETTQAEDENEELTLEEESQSESEEEQILLTPIEETETNEEDIQETEELVEEESGEFLPVIDWNSFANLILEEKELKRGSYVQGKDGGYFVNKAYKEERSKMDKSEEKMMNVWSNLSKENQQRKLERRKQASGSYFRQEPRKPIEPEVVETEIEEVEAKESPFKTAPMSETQRVNQMTDEEREKAGYEKVTINFKGNEISFWQKKVKE